MTYFKYKDTAMKIRALLSLVTIPAVILAAVIFCPTSLQAAGTTDGTGVLIAQYLEDKENGRDTKSQKETILDYQKKEMLPTPHFIMGIGGGLDAREGFGSASIALPLGVQYGHFTMIFDTAFVYSNAKSLRQNKPDLFDTIMRTKMSGQIIELHLPFKFSYSILDLEKYVYTPYLSAGIGYSYRKFYLRGTSALNRITREYGINSLTLNYGFGFLVRTSQDTRFNVGITGISYLNNRSGAFNYDTTGASLLMGILLIL